MPTYRFKTPEGTFDVTAPDAETAVAHFNPNFKLPVEEPKMEEIVVEKPRYLDRQAAYRGGQAFGRRMVRGALAQPVAGIAGLLGAAVGGLDTAVAWKEGVEQKITGSPSSIEEAKFAAEMAEAPFIKTAGKLAEVADEELLKLSGKIPRAVSKGNPASMLADLVARRAVEEMRLNGEDQDENTINAIAAGSPAIATGIKTLVLGGPEIFALKGMDIPRRALAAKRLRATQKELLKDVTKQAEGMGLKLTNDELVDSTLEVAERMAPDRHRAAGASDVQFGVQDAAEKAEAAIDTARDAARTAGRRSYVSAKDLSDLGKDIQDHLVQSGFDLPNMPAVKSVIRDMRRATKVVPGDVRPIRGAKIQSISLNQLDILRRRVTRGIRNNGSDQDSALRSIRAELDRHLQDAFDSDAIRGDPAAQAQWKNVHDLVAEYERTFDTDDTIRRLLSKDASPEDVVKWVMGANAQSAKIGSASLVRRLKQILGPNHPGIVAMRNSALRDVLAPLFADKPNFKAAIKNIDNLTQNNYSLASELAIPRSDLQKLRQAAHAAQFVKPTAPAILQKRWLSRLAASLIWGHDLAKRSRIVQLGHKIIDHLIGTGVLQRRDIIKHLAETQEMSAMPMKNIPSKRMGAFLGGAALADIGERTAGEYSEGDVLSVEEMQ